MSQSEPAAGKAVNPFNLVGLEHSLQPTKVFDRLSTHWPLVNLCKQEAMEIDITCGGQCVKSMQTAGRLHNINTTCTNSNCSSPNIMKNRKRVHEDDLMRSTVISKRLRLCPPVVENKPTYDPEIVFWNNNYFYINKLLFELHLERLQRMMQQ